MFGYIFVFLVLVIKGKDRPYHKLRVFPVSHPASGLDIRRGDRSHQLDLENRPENQDLRLLLAAPTAPNTSGAGEGN